MKMTWNELQLISCQKMFINNTTIFPTEMSELKNDRNFKLYLNAMPYTANEGMNILITRGKPYHKVYTITTTDITNGYIDLTLITNLKKVEGILKDGVLYNDVVVNANKLYINFDPADVTMLYQAYPTKITSDTLGAEEIDLPYDMVSILPLYIASEEYKDDDISLATIYRNQFEVELENLTPDNYTQDFANTNNWL